jgi:hypothetical protein
MTSATILETTCVLQLCQNEQKTCEDKFKTTIMEAIDESFSSFSNSDKERIYFYLENTYKIMKTQIPRKIENFTNAIEQMFGIGAKLIEIKIVEAVHKRVKDFAFFPRKGDIYFSEYIASLRAFLLNNS